MVVKNMGDTFLKQRINIKFFVKLHRNAAEVLRMLQQDCGEGRMNKTQRSEDAVGRDWFKYGKVSEIVRNNH